MALSPLGQLFRLMGLLATCAVPNVLLIISIIVLKSGGGQFRESGGGEKRNETITSEQTSRTKCIT